MKNLIYVLIAITILITACEEKADIVNQENHFKNSLQDELVVSNDINDTLEAKVLDWKERELKQSISINDTNINLSFNFASLVSSGLSTNNYRAIIVPQVGYDNTRETNYDLALFYEVGEGEILNKVVQRTDVLSNGTVEYNYYKLDGSYIFNVELNPTDSTITFNGEIVGLKADGGWGDDTLDCIESVYTDNGWISVWAWVQTGFIPMTGAGIAAYCAGANAPILD